MAVWEAFTGGCYRGRAQQASTERSMNLYPERIEDQDAASKTRRILMSKPGTAQFANCGTAAAGAQLNGRVFACTASQFVEVFANGTYTNRGAIAFDARPQICAGTTQLLILAGGLGYIFDLTANTLTGIADPNFPAGATKAGFIDGYFLVLEANSQTFAISNLNDGTTWDGLDFGDVEGQPGNVVTFLVDHSLVWFLGTTHSEAYYDAGNANFPFSRYQGSAFDQGCAGVDAACIFDNTIAFIGANQDGQGIVYRLNGFSPDRISTQAVEAAIQSYPTIADASLYTYQDSGHSFLVCQFPSARNGLGATWVYDAATQLWHERGLWDAALCDYHADVARFHVAAWGMHLVGGAALPGLFQMSQTIYQDNGQPIRRERVPPTLANGGNWTFYAELRLLCEFGVGLDGTPASGADPQITLQLSDDGGMTFGNARAASMGKIGQYRKLARWRQLGCSRDRVFKVVCSEPVFVSILEADLESK